MYGLVIAFVSSRAAIAAEGSGFLGDRARAAARLVRSGLRVPTVALALGLAGTAWAAPPAPVTADLTVQQVQTVDGQTVLKPAQVTKPGDVLEYRVSYTNHTASPVSGLIANLPIPAGTTLIDRTALPPGVLASTDGVKFAPVPLERVVHLADGSLRSEPVPLEEYRALRWNLGTLAAGANLQVQARVRVSAVSPPAGSPPTGAAKPLG